MDALIWLARELTNGEEDQIDSAMFAGFFPSTSDVIQDQRVASQQNSFALVNIFLNNFIIAEYAWGP